MEPRTSTRSGQIATNMPLKNAFGKRWATHKIQLSKKWGCPGSPFPRGNSKGDHIYVFDYFHVRIYVYIIYCVYIVCLCDLLICVYYLLVYLSISVFHFAQGFHRRLCRSGSTSLGNSPGYPSTFTVTNVENRIGFPKIIYEWWLFHMSMFVFRRVTWIPSQTKFHWVNSKMSRHVPSLFPASPQPPRHLHSRLHLLAGRLNLPKAPSQCQQNANRCQ